MYDSCNARAVGGLRHVCDLHALHSACLLVGWAHMRHTTQQSTQAGTHHVLLGVLLGVGGCACGLDVSQLLSSCISLLSLVALKVRV